MTIKQQKIPNFNGTIFATTSGFEHVLQNPKGEIPRKTKNRDDKKRVGVPIVFLNLYGDIKFDIWIEKIKDETQTGKLREIYLIMETTERVLLLEPKTIKHIVTFRFIFFFFKL